MECISDVQAVRGGASFMLVAHPWLKQVAKEGQKMPEAGISGRQWHAAAELIGTMASSGCQSIRGKALEDVMMRACTW